MVESKRGKFVTFEGIDGVGKTTQIQKVYQWLQQHPERPPQHPVFLTKEPGDTDLGRQLRSILLSNDWHDAPLEPTAELLLYTADRTQHVQTVLRPRLATGTIILCDRYTDSTVAYQGYGRSLSLELIEQLNSIATQGLTSDLTIWLDLETDASWHRLRQRGQFDRMEASNLDFHRRVRQGFIHLAQRYPERIVKVDASGTEEAVAQAIQAIIRDRILNPLLQNSETPIATDV